jgi:hypothetical protein
MQRCPCGECCKGGLDVFGTASPVWAPPFARRGGWWKAACPYYAPRPHSHTSSPCPLSPRWAPPSVPGWLSLFLGHFKDVPCTHAARTWPGPPSSLEGWYGTPVRKLATIGASGNSTRKQYGRREVQTGAASMKKPRQKAGALNMPGAVCATRPQRTGAYLPQAAWRKCELVHGRGSVLSDNLGNHDRR